jgi:hypothetical protein
VLPDGVDVTDAVTLVLEWCAVSLHEMRPTAFLAILFGLRDAENVLEHPGIVEVAKIRTWKAASAKKDNLTTCDVSPKNDGTRN